MSSGQSWTRGAESAVPSQRHTDGNDRDASTAAADNRGAWDDDDAGVPPRERPTDESDAGGGSRQSTGEPKTELRSRWRDLGRAARRQGPAASYEQLGEDDYWSYLRGERDLSEPAGAGPAEPRPADPGPADPGPTEPGPVDPAPRGFRKPSPGPTADRPRHGPPADTPDPGAERWPAPAARPEREQAGYEPPGFGPPGHGPPGYEPADYGPAGYGPAGYGPAERAVPERAVPERAVPERAMPERAMAEAEPAEPETAERETPGKRSERGGRRWGLFGRRRSEPAEPDLSAGDPAAPARPIPGADLPGGGATFADGPGQPFAGSAGQLFTGGGQASDGGGAAAWPSEPERPSETAWTDWPSEPERPSEAWTEWPSEAERGPGPARSDERAPAASAPTPGAPASAPPAPDASRRRSRRAEPPQWSSGSDEPPQWSGGAATADPATERASDPAPPFWSSRSDEAAQWSTTGDTGGFWPAIGDDPEQPVVEATGPAPEPPEWSVRRRLSPNPPESPTAATPRAYQPDRSYADPSYADQSYPDPSHADPSHAASSYAEPSYAEPDVERSPSDTWFGGPDEPPVARAMPPVAPELPPLSAASASESLFAPDPTPTASPGMTEPSVPDSGTRPPDRRSAWAAVRRTMATDPITGQQPAVDVEPPPAWRKLIRSGRRERVRPGIARPVALTVVAALAWLAVVAYGVLRFDLLWSLGALVAGAAGLALGVRGRSVIGLLPVLLGAGAWGMATGGEVPSSFTNVVGDLRLIGWNVAFAVPLLVAYGFATWVDASRYARDRVDVALGGRRWFGTADAPDAEPGIAVMETVPSARFFQLQSGSSPHLVTAGRRVALIRSTVWPRGDYTVTEVGEVQRNGRVYANGSDDLGGMVTDLRTWADRLESVAPDGLGFLVVHPASGRPADKVGIDIPETRGVRVIRADQFVAEVGEYLAGEPYRIDVPLTERLAEYLPIFESDEDAAPAG